MTDHAPLPFAQAPTHALYMALCLLLCVSFITGGSSQQAGLGVAFAQLLALPVLAWSAFVLATQPSSRLQRAGIIAMLLVAAVPLLQLLPIPAALWQWPAARGVLAHDLAAAGVTPVHRWTLTPSATWRAALSLLPALAMFLGTLALSQQQSRRLLVWVEVLAGLSLLLGMAQLGLPRDNFLNPFPRWLPRLNGLFANPNHQATMLVIAAVLAAGFAVEAARRVIGRMASSWAPWLWGLTSLVFLLALPVISSRAGVIIGMLAMVAVLLALGVFRPQQLRASSRRQVALLLVAGVAAIGLYGAIGWMQADEVGELRPYLARATWALGWQHAPLGSGMGSFVQVFEQEAPTALLGPAYVNHAHNEYPQWWLEGGVLALLALTAALWVLGAAAVRLLASRSCESAIAIAALVSTLVVLVHSAVDYPLRTPALMTVTALLAGLVVSRCHRNGDETSHTTGRMPQRPS